MTTGRLDQLAALRAELDALDERLREMLRTRFALCCEIGDHKRALGMSLVQHERVRIVQANAARFALEHGMNPEFMRDLYSLLIDEAHRLEGEVFARRRTSTGVDNQ